MQKNEWKTLKTHKNTQNSKTRQNMEQFVYSLTLWNVFLKFSKIVWF